MLIQFLREKRVLSQICNLTFVLKRFRNGEWREEGGGSGGVRCGGVEWLVNGREGWLEREIV